MIASWQAFTPWCRVQARFTKTHSSSTVPQFHSEDPPKNWQIFGTLQLYMALHVVAIDSNCLVAFVVAFSFQSLFGSTMRLNAWWIVALPSLPLCQSHPLNLLDALQQAPSNQLLEAAKLLEAAEDLENFDRKLPSAKPSEPQRPRVPRRFRADTKFVSNPAMAGVGPGMFAQDADEKFLRIEEVRSFPFGNQYFSNLLLANEAYTITGGNHSICRRLPMFGMQKFVDLFAWAASPLLSEYAGERTVAGRVCSQWQLRSKNHSLSLCADGDIPVELNMTSSISGIPSATSYQFGPLVTGEQVPQSLFVKPDACEELAPPCESGRGKGPVVLEAYVFHPAISTGDYNIEDQDIADLEGDAFFICADRMMNQSSSTIDHNYTRISHYLLEISPAFGQYAVCNGYPDTSPPGPACFGGDPRLVGKEAPFFVGDGESRCMDKSPSGFWFSVPKAGRCPAGQSPSSTAASSGCTWSIQKRLKTIQQSCLLQTHRFLELCKEGMPKSVAALRAAFTSEELASGGCPDVGGPNEEDLALVV